MDTQLNEIEQHSIRNINVTNWLALFVLSYFSLYTNSGQFLTSFLFEWMYSLVVPPFASLLGTENLTRINYTGSGDTPFHFFQVFLMITLAIVGSIVLLFTLRKEKHFKLFEKIVYMLVRYYLVYLMIIYGLAKVFYLQFQYPGDILLERTLGDMSPMGLMWTFMGYSKGYTMFVGWLEFIGGVFILFRRTTVLGALMTFGVMLNVFVLNMCYDVPVKLLSLHMVLMSLFLLYPVKSEVLSFFFSRGKVIRSKIPFFDYGKADNIMFWFKIGLLIIMLIRMGSTNIIRYNKVNQTQLFSKKYEVVEHKVFNDNIEIDEVPEVKKWESISPVSSGYISVKQADGDMVYYSVEVDDDKQTLGLKKHGSGEYQELHYSVDSLNHCHLYGPFYEDSISVQLKKTEKDFLLRTREFHWMQEQAFNR